MSNGADLKIKNFQFVVEAALKKNANENILQINHPLPIMAFY
jgi:hypothetical protein